MKSRFCGREDALFTGDLVLIVTCAECSTRFQLDEARIPETGARVRCSRCKHAFFLPSPSASGDGALHGIAEQAAADPSSQLPEASDDLVGVRGGSPPTKAGVSGGVPLPASGRADTLSAPDAEPEEEDWQFSEEVRVEGDDGDEAIGFVSDKSTHDVPRGQRSGNDSRVSDVSTDFRGGDFSEDSFRGAVGVGADQNSAGALYESLNEDSDFGSVDDFSSLMEDDESPVASEGGSRVGLRGPTPPVEDGEVGDDLGDPESWDLVGSGPSFVDDWGPTLGGALDEGNSLAAGQFRASQSHDAFGKVDRGAEYGAGSLLAGAGGKFLRALGWIACAAAVGSVAFLALRAEWLRSVETLQTVGFGPLVAETTSSGWIETERAGPVLRFSGRVRNTIAEAVWPGSVRLVLLDETGSRVTAPPIVGGLPLPEAVLRESSAAALSERAKGAILRHRNTPLAPDEARRFEALLSASQLPKDAARVLLEVGESRLASGPAPRLPASP